MIREIKIITYTDSNMIHEQTDEVCSPETNQTIGFVIEETKDHITLAAEFCGDEYRRQISIPKVAIIKKETL